MEEDLSSRHRALWSMRVTFDEYLGTMQGLLTEPA